MIWCKSVLIFELLIRNQKPQKWQLLCTLLYELWPFPKLYEEYFDRSWLWTKTVKAEYILNLMHRIHFWHQCSWQVHLSLTLHESSVICRVGQVPVKQCLVLLNFSSRPSAAQKSKVLSSKHMAVNQDSMSRHFCWHFHSSTGWVHNILMILCCLLQMSVSCNVVASGELGLLRRNSPFHWLCKTSLFMIM